MPLTDRVGAHDSSSYAGDPLLTGGAHERGESLCVDRRVERAQP
jgi:hypothetical protein